MKIMITTKGENLEAEIDPRFGRAQNFLLYDSEEKTFSIVDNSKNLNGMQGVGIQAAKSVANSGASVLITGNCGPKAYQVLSAAGIKVYTGAKGTVMDAIEAFTSGNLSQADSANVEGHW
jgi:predicted Fe-Mo cluster-binding NifX family protein